MPIKKIAFLAICFLIPSFVYLVMCPFAHSLTLNAGNHLVLIQQQIQKTQLQQNEYASSHISHHSMGLFKLHTDVKAAMPSPLSTPLEPPFSLALLKTFRLNL